MHLDVLDLREFYYRSGLGRAAQSAIRSQVGAIWPELPRMTVLGYGFAVPLLRPYLGEARRVAALMPGQQGVMHWPAGLPNVSVLCEETRWPIATDTVDRLIVMHGLETSERPAALLEECARVLAPGGRALFIVPNRRGLWARRDGTPFGQGRPYSLSQLESLLSGHGFSPGRHVAALFFPPSQQRFWMRSARFWERLGRRVSNYYAGGVLLVEAERTDMPPARSGLADVVRGPLRILEGAPRPGPKPA